MLGLAVKKDFLLVSVIGALVGFFIIPILENIRPPQWELTFLTAGALIIGFSAFANLALWIAGLIGAKYPSIFQFAKYAATGAMNSATDLGIFNFLSMSFGVFSGPLIVLFNSLSFSVAVTNSYFWNNLWAFKKEGAKLGFSQYFKFVGVTVGGLVINNIIVYIVTTTIGAPGSISEALWENVAKLVAVPAAVLWNFFGYKMLVFRVRQD